MDITPNAMHEKDTTEIKSCCATAYQSDWARLILGDSFHPGGVQLTERLGSMIGLGVGKCVLDIASGQGTSAIRLAQRFGCDVVGVDYGHEAIQNAKQAVQVAGVSHLVSFQQGDAEHLPVEDGFFDAVICECAFCTFPAKPTAAAEFLRVLKPGGRVGLSDLTRSGDVPEDLQGLLAWIACIADAQPIEEYQRYLVEGGLVVNQIEPHNEALSDIVRRIQGKLLGAELLVKLKKIELPDTIDFDQAKAFAKSAAAAIQANQFGYVVMTATKPQ
jgi:ubiquinone/menaquinone biosynthesis C-methylase UbiE